ncbi:hypothetical protein [Reyranella sp. CPCC 100927]|uniref:hypothetical protein n=1 Tax=Reyranella sp. CPCC 100927 TaxID=2599616 RepID=UPI0011B5FBF5|nr:hypothetical protein [Reyranella sp. CPCC 100927]TWT08821.1 hypothetical protein FQU96_22635 [Reyranella sp. CPCC 100927]
MASHRSVLGLAALMLALAACATGTAPSTSAGPSGSWSQTADGRIAVSDPGVLGYSVTIPAGWHLATGASQSQAAALIAPREGGSTAEIGIVRFVAGETPERTALRLAQRAAPTSDAAQSPSTLAPIPLQSGGGRRAQVYSIPQRATERVVVVALIAESGVWAYQILNAASRGAYDRSMPLMRNIVASYRPDAR